MYDLTIQSVTDHGVKERLLTSSFAVDMYEMDISADTFLMRPPV